jgi:atypical dual specificity phosphatase
MVFPDPQPWQTSLISAIAKHERSGQRPLSANENAVSEVVPRLYLTNIFTAHDEAQLSRLGITHVVSVVESAPTLSQTQPLRMLHIPLKDYPSQDILTHFPVTTLFIRNALAEDPNSRVLVSSCGFYVSCPVINPFHSGPLFYGN